MKKFWQTNLIPPHIQEVIEKTMRHATSVAKSGQIPTQQPLELINELVESLKEAESIAKEKAEQLKQESEQKEADIENVPDEKIIKESD